MDTESAVEDLLRYKFTNRSLLEMAFTHPSFPDSPSYERLEFVGDAVLGCAFSDYLFRMHTAFGPGELTAVKSANVGTEKLARAAVKHGLYLYIRHAAPPLAQKVRKFVDVVHKEDGLSIHGGLMKAPKILADIVEALAAAVYVDCGFDLKRLWLVFRPLLEPIVTPEDLKEQPQPVSLLFHLCQKEGKLVEIKDQRKGSRAVATVYINGLAVGSGASEQREFARLAAAKEVLPKLSPGIINLLNEANAAYELGTAKPTLHELCAKKKWPKPEYKVENQEGPPHDQKFRCSVMIKAVSVPCMKGDFRPRIKDAESSASLFMLHCLRNLDMQSDNTCKDIRKT